MGNKYCIIANMLKNLWIYAIKTVKRVSSWLDNDLKKIVAGWTPVAKMFPFLGPFWKFLAIFNP